jgi:cytochrome c oxidase assembly protein subunit 15
VVRLQPRRYRNITIAALVALSVIVVTGAGVRLTGSGLGCEDWPNCNNEKLIDVSTGHAAIEQLNRLFTGVVAISVIAAVLGSLIRAPRRRDLTWLSLGLVAGVIAQIILGAITVWTDLHPMAVQGHFLLSMVIIANAVVLVRRAGEPDGVPRRDVVAPEIRRAVITLFVMTSVAVFTGTLVTGAGPHAGDENARRFGFDISDVARVHGLSVVLTIALALALLLGTRRFADLRRLREPLTTWAFVAVLQALIGYVQYFNGVPALLVAIHITGATGLYIVTVQLVLDTRRAVQPATDPAEVGPPSTPADDRSTDPVVGSGAGLGSGQ